MALTKFYTKDNVSAQLDGGINASQTTILFKNSLNFPANGTSNIILTLMQFDSNDLLVKFEKILVSNITGGNTLTVTRGYDGSTASSFNNNDYIYLNVTSKIITDIQDELVRLESAKADKATTLSGYGITDAYTQSTVNSLLNAKANLSGGNTFSGIQAFGNLRLNGNSLENYIDNADDGAVVINYSGYSGGTTKYRDFKVFNGKNGTAIFTVDGSAGNVGIGTETPVDKLEVAGKIKFGTDLVSYIDSGANGRVQLVSKRGIGTTSSQGIEIFTYNGTTDILRIVVGGDSIKLRSQLDTEILRALNNGNVLIGSTNDIGDKLYVNGTFRANQIYVGGNQINEWSTAGDTGGIAVNYNGYNLGNTYFRNFGVFGGKQGNEILQVVGSTNKVLTQALSPRADNSYSLGESTLKWSVVYSSTGTINTSDEKLKKDILPNTLGIDFIKAIEAVSYKFKVGGYKNTEVEEEVEEEVPVFEEVEVEKQIEEKVDGKIIIKIIKEIQKVPVFEEVEIIDENGNQKFFEEEVPVFEEVEEEVEQIEIIEGVAISKKVVIKKQVPQFEVFDVVDSEGNIIFEVQKRAKKELITKKIVTQNQKGEDQIEEVEEEVETFEEIQVPKKLYKQKIQIIKIPLKGRVQKKEIQKVLKVKEKLEEVTGKRTHYGFIAQQIEKVLKEKFDNTDFAGLVITPEGEYGLRYEQFIPILTTALQQVIERVENLEAKIK